MKTYLTTIIMLIIFSFAAYAQGYEQWKANQKSSTHLKANYTHKKTYFSPTAKTIDFYLKQYQKYNNKGRLIEDVLYQNRLTQLYDIQIQYKDSTTARSTNKLDSSTAIYKFSETGKITYYLTADKVGLFINYQYDSLDRLLSCKDCMAPFGNTMQCAYYQYIYKGDKLVKIKQYSLNKVQLSTAGDLYAVDSLVYKENQLIEKHFIDLFTGHVRHKNIYSYNKQQQCTQLVEYRKLAQTGLAEEIWKTTYRYRCNGQLKKKRTTLLLSVDEPALQAIKVVYNSKGWKKKSKMINLKDKTKKSYRFEYN